ncbi:MAG: archaetidylserine decarboxylase [Nibricoccus sp.]
MPTDPIRFYNRHTRSIETEEIYGEGWLRFTYENPVGKFFLWLIVKRALFSHFYGWQMNKRVSAGRVLPFIIKYNLDVTIFQKSVYDFKSFNEFFYRKLKREARPIAEGNDVAVFPADGRHLVFPNVDEATGFYVKGAKFSLVELLGEEHLPEDQRVRSKLFEGGSMVISRLCPVDYHRFHFPVEGVPTKPELINGALYSVSPIALRKKVKYLVQNKRMITIVDSPSFGHVACMEVGATNVGSIVQTLIPGRTAEKGEEKGLFKFGGSCVITLFQKGRILFDGDLVEQSRECVETYAWMGERLGVAAR